MATLWTVGKLATRFSVPVAAVSYVLRTRDIGHIGMAGNCRVYDDIGASAIGHALRQIAKDKGATFRDSLGVVEPFDNLSNE